MPANTNASKHQWMQTPNERRRRRTLMWWLKQLFSMMDILRLCWRQCTCYIGTSTLFYRSQFYWAGMLVWWVAVSWMVTTAFSFLLLLSFLWVTWADVISKHQDIKPCVFYTELSRLSFLRVMLYKNHANVDAYFHMISVGFPTMEFPRPKSMLSWLTGETGVQVESAMCELQWLLSEASDAAQL